MRILNVIVFYNNREEIERYIKRLFQISQSQVDVAVVVNSDTSNESCDMLNSLKNNGIESVYLRYFDENVGYLNALLKEIQLVDIGKYDYYILSNTDINYCQDNFFDVLKEMKYDAAIGCIAPSVFATKTRSFSNPHYKHRIDKRKLIRLSSIFSHPFIGKLYLRLGDFKSHRTKKTKECSCFVYSPHGCYMIFTKSFINHLVGYEYGAKMYSEESIVGELLLKYDYRCFYDEHLEVEHQENSVTGKIDYKKRFEMWKASIDYLLKHFYQDK